MRHEAVERVDIVVNERRDTVDVNNDVIITRAFFESDTGGEAVASVELILDGVGVERTVRNEVVVDDRTGIVGKGVEERIGLTNQEAAEFDVSVVDRDFFVGLNDRKSSVSATPSPSTSIAEVALICVEVEVDLHIATQGAELGLGAGVKTQGRTSALVVGVVDVDNAILKQVELVDRLLT